MQNYPQYIRWPNSISAAYKYSKINEIDILLHININTMWKIFMSKNILGPHSHIGVDHTKTKRQKISLNPERHLKQESPDLFSLR